VSGLWLAQARNGRSVVEYSQKSTVRIVSSNLSGVNGFAKHAWKPSIRALACVTKADIAITGTLPPAAGPMARISLSTSKPSRPGILMSHNTKFGRLVLTASTPSTAFLASTTFAPKRPKKLPRNLRVSS
jgi:hypothetical protein